MLCIFIARFQVENILFIYSDIQKEWKRQREIELAIYVSRISRLAFLWKSVLLHRARDKNKSRPVCSVELEKENENENKKWDQEHDHEPSSRRNICEKNLTSKLSKCQNDYWDGLIVVRVSGQGKMHKRKKNKIK